MLRLDARITLDAKAIAATNLCDRFKQKDLDSIGTWVYDGYLRDKGTRSRWEIRSQAALDLAMQMTAEKSFPWPNCSNVAFPLVTIATMQFHARAYPTIISGTDVVKCRTIGEDPTGEKRARADRISTHMSYQVLEEDRAWEEQHDRLLINLPIVGCAFVKSYFSPSRNHNVSELVLAQDLVVDYYAKSIETASRKTQRIPLYRNEMWTKCKTGVFRDILNDGWYLSPSAPSPQAGDGKDKRQGTNPPMPDETTPLVTLEQHCSLDLDGDGYAEPYIITIEETSKAVLRIVCRFDEEADITRGTGGVIASIRATEYFTKYSFIPSPDGGIYDVGFGVLLGPLNESVNSLLNQLVDAGTMNNTAGGFLARGAKIRGGVYTFAPLEWKRVDSTGEDLQKSIYPLPVREPSQVLFALLSLLINYTSRVSGSTDPMVGENPGQNTPAETTRNMIEQGSKIYTALFKRVWRCMKGEFEKLYILNGLFMPTKVNFGTANSFALREDYLGDPHDVAPAADPAITSDAMLLQQASAVKAAAMQTPGYNRDEVEKFYLKALRVPNVDGLFPGTKGQQAPEDPKVQVERLRLQWKQMEFQGKQAQFAAQLMEEQRLNTAEILKIQAEIAKITADVSGDQVDRQINALNTALGFMKHHDEKLRGRIELVLNAIEIGKDSENGGTEQGSMGGLALPAGNGSLPGIPAQQAAGVA